MSEDVDVLDNIGLVLKQAKKFRPTQVTDLDDYIQVGLIGLLKAIRAYDSNRGSFSSFAWPIIKNHIISESKRFAQVATAIENIDEVEILEPSTKLKEIMIDLEENDILIVSMRFSGYTFKEIGSKLGITKQGAQYRFKQSVKRIKEINGKKKNSPCRGSQFP